MAVKATKEKTSLGKVLLNCSLINQDQLQEALLKQKEGEQRIGEILISLGAVTQDEINWALGTQLDIPYLELTQEVVDQDLIKSFPSDMLRRYQTIPVIEVNNEITLAMADPTDTKAIDDLRSFTKSKIKTAVATSSNIMTIINEVFGPPETDREKAPKHQIQLEEMSRETLEKLIYKDVSGNTFVNYILIQATKDEASEIHIQPVSNSLWVRYRIKGKLKTLGSYPISLFSRVLTRIKIMGGLDPLREGEYEESNIEAQILDKVLDLHISFLPAINGESIFIRLISHQKVLPTLEDCGFDEEDISCVSKILLKPSGVIIVTGRERSGCTRTLYSLLGKINTPQKKIITIEDDIQHRVGEFVQLQTRGGESYGQVLEKVLTHNSDVVMIKDLNDKKVLSRSFQAALAGRLIFGELNYRDSFDALENILSTNLERILISSTLLAIIAQKLVYRLCDKCKQPYTPKKIKGLDLPEEITFFTAKGCPECGFTGLTDEILINEILPVTSEIKKLILTGEPRKVIYQKAKEMGMKTIFDKGLEKVKNGIISLEEIL